MDDYISRDEAMSLPVLPKEQRIQLDNVDEAFEEGWRQALENLAILPAADVVEVRHEPYMALSTVEVVAVRHGRWLRTPTGWVYCSVCREEPPEETNARTKYCPNCGAVMDGGQDDGD